MKSEIIFYLQDLSVHKKIKQAVTEKEGKVKGDRKSSVSDDSKETKSKVSKIKEIKMAKGEKGHKTQHQSKGKPTILDKGGKIIEDDLDRGRQKFQPLEPWSLGPSHNKIPNKHHAANTEQ
jgi:hypothetical protein